MLDTFEENPHKFLRLDDLEVKRELYMKAISKLKYSLASLSIRRFRFIGFARRRAGRGGRLILDELLSRSQWLHFMQFNC